MSISEDVLNNMGSLEGLIAERGYTTGIVPMQGETVVRNEFDPIAPAVSAQNPYAAAGAVSPFPHGAVPETPGLGVVPQSVAAPAPPVQPYVAPRPAAPQISTEQYQAAMAYAARMRDEAEQLALAKQEVEDQLFLESIAHLPQDAQDAQVALRYAQQLESVLTKNEETNRERAAAEEEEEQRYYKGEVAYKLATKAGLPWGNEGIRNALLSAPDRRTMDSIIAGLRTLTPAQQTAAAAGLAPQQPVAMTPAQIAAQQLVAAPGRGSNGAARSGIKPHSGDISGLIKSKAYQAISQ